MIPHPADVLSAGPPDAVCMPNAIVNGISIDYTVTGDGPPVLLICGTGQPADLWFAQVTDLAAAGHTVITSTTEATGVLRRHLRPTWSPTWPPTPRP